MLSKMRLFTKFEAQMLPQYIRRFCTVKEPTATITPDNIMDVVNQIPNDEHSQKPQIVDINIDAMMEDDHEFGESIGQPPKQSIHQPEGPTIESKDIDGVHIAPVDINPWLDEEEMAEGTVDMERIMREQKPLEYPPPPEKREASTYQFKGIKIRLPSSMLTKGTFRYRLDQEDEGLADDTRICKFT